MEVAFWIPTVCLYRLGSAGKETPAAYSFQRRITRRQSTVLAFPLPRYTNKRLKYNYRLYNQHEEKDCVVIDVIFYKYSGCLRNGGKKCFQKKYFSVMMIKDLMGVICPLKLDFRLYLMKINRVNCPCVPAGYPYTPTRHASFSLPSVSRSTLCRFFLCVQKVSDLSYISALCKAPSKAQTLLSREDWFSHYRAGAGALNRHCNSRQDLQVFLSSWESSAQFG